MLREALEELSIAVAGIFEHRLPNSATEDDEEQWNVYEVSLIPKKLAPKYATDFRPTAITPVMRKLYFMVLGCLMNTHTIPLGNRQFAFRPRYQASEVLVIMRMIGEKANVFDLN